MTSRANNEALFKAIDFYVLFQEIQWYLALVLWLYLFYSKKKIKRNSDFKSLFVEAGSLTTSIISGFHIIFIGVYLWVGYMEISILLKNSSKIFENLTRGDGFFFIVAGVCVLYESLKDVAIHQSRALKRIMNKLLRRWNFRIF